MSILGVWMWPTNVRMYGAQHVVEKCARAGVTDIYFLTKGLAGTTAYQGRFAPCGYEYDLFRELLDAAHKSGIRVHAWFTSASDEHYKPLHPESGRFHYVRGRDRGLISLRDEGYLSYMENITHELCRNYDIDGLHLDYIRYNHLSYGWDEEDKKRYAQEGADMGRLEAMMDRAFSSDAPEGPDKMFEAYRAGDESVLALARARKKDVVNFASLLTGVARAEKNKLILSAALMPEGAYDDIAFSDLHYGQNYEDAAKLYDYALPMAYSKAYEKDGAWVRMVAEGTMKRGMKTIVGLHAYQGGTGPSLAADIEALRDSKVEGICLFREGATAFAYRNGTHVNVFNALEETIVRITAADGVREEEVTSEIQPGAEKEFRFAFEPKLMRVFTNAGEVSVFLTPDRAAK